MRSYERAFLKMFLVVNKYAVDGCNRLEYTYYMCIKVHYALDNLLRNTRQHDYFTISHIQTHKGRQTTIKVKQLLH